MRYISIVLLPLMFLIVSLISCNKGGTEDSGEINALNLSFEKINEWNISDSAVLPQPADAKVLDDGTLVIVDRALNTINHFEENGQLIKTIGGQGRGPGEYQNISAVAIHSDGRVAVADISAAAVTISDVYSGQRVRDVIESGWNMALQWAGDKIIYSAHPFNIMAENSGDIILVQFDSTLKNKEQFMRLELQRDDPPEEQISCMFCHFWFLEDLSFYTSPNDQRYLAYYVTPENGDTFKISRSDIGPVEYSELELDQLADRRRAAAAMSGIKLNTDDLPKYKRMIIEMFTDHEDRLWVLRHTTVGKQVFDLFDQQQEFIGSVQKPDAAMGVISVTGNTILFRQDASDHEPDGAWQAALYRISG